ncbi:MAG: hypothetical protein A2504_00335 [Bdellovibrionales bacterium RIFOXYD12_FULL_39_22]|nr:MAG: hypothetical protein A2385_13915 [Bdellovibrionales bacterium RIFOXYB1_FULL_39_21]OFZ42428.1 MAG: hypothetical protein A2485_03965 [Bdellovibrionales bacterium RIFOXYC12_FULL_39_17]OFZ45404.1 MAG: hypothetical protein A2404_01405 [Bdellovibrionales bacterium RIFOXYC1_FULL_39_130]OFZ73193.1 MAG: hypothetical protein A2451_16770 [Bdellovibrionales bacterium RIFOXYC2_FULL_39_8]OFZ74601.1 MAG: hypothetical protein A2560_09435 [Bdellovibrionales bacterium RIFOXYD1_FULL_39_84]OFZ92883.1 MAG:
MKIPKQISEIYSDLEPKYKLLMANVDDILHSLIKEKNWFYRSRIKRQNSFYQKIETNSQYSVGNYEDFFGCEIIVDTKSEINEAVKLIQDYFMINYQRPKQLDSTSDNPYDFKFSDLRLYVSKSSPVGMPEKPWYNLVFEIQIKTIFSYSWSKATHDLIYKAGEVSWAKERVAFQVKAMLEQSEYAISNIAITNDNFFPEHPKFSSQKKLINLFSSKWPNELLPDDMRRCTENILKLGLSFRASHHETLQLINNCLTDDFVTKHRELSPFFASLVIFTSSEFAVNIDEKNPTLRNKFYIFEEIVSYISQNFFDKLVTNEYVFLLSTNKDSATTCNQS